MERAISGSDFVPAQLCVDQFVDMHQALRYISGPMDYHLAVFEEFGNYSHCVVVRHGNCLENCLAHCVYHAHQHLRQDELYHFYNDHEHDTDHREDTSGGAIQTQCCFLVVVMLRSGYTLRSSAQMEFNKCDARDQSKHVNGCPSTTMFVGYIIPLIFRNGLSRLHGELPTIHHVFPTIELEWDPSALDPDPAVFPTIELEWDPSALDPDPADKEQWFATPSVCFHFWVKVNHQKEDHGFPIESKEVSGHRVDASVSFGTTMTWSITQKIFYWSPVWSASSTNSSLHATLLGGESFPHTSDSIIQLQSDGEPNQTQD